MKKIGRLEIIAFVTGFGLMTFELAAARVLAPTVGSSTYVWTSVIGVIIAALSLGYWVGGILADRRKHEYDIATFLLVTAAAVALCLITYQDILVWLAATGMDVRLQAVIAALVLFAPASFMLGMISPYLAKFNVRSLAGSGRAVASLSAFNSIGGIIGTFLTGFFLFGVIGSRQTIVLVGALLLATSWIIVVREKVAPRVIATVMIGLVLLVGSQAPATNIISLDTASAHYEIVDFSYESEAVRGLTTGPNGVQSAVSLNGSKEPVFWYTQELSRITLAQQPESVLILGGGTFTLPGYLAEQLPDTQIDVVEIDPELKNIATKYFNYEDSANVNLIFSDARTYINQTDKKYDTIIVDVYGDAQIPFSLMTREYGQQIAQRLTGDGAILANIIGGEVGPCRDIFDAANAAYLTSLSTASYVSNPMGSIARTNIIALYSNDNKERYGLTPVSARSSAYTDNFMPSERLYFACASHEA